MRSIRPTTRTQATANQNQSTDHPAPGQVGARDGADETSRFAILRVPRTPTRHGSERATLIIPAPPVRSDRTVAARRRVALTRVPRTSHGSAGVTVRCGGSASRRS